MCPLMWLDATESRNHTHTYIHTLTLTHTHTHTTLHTHTTHTHTHTTAITTIIVIIMIVQIKFILWSTILRMNKVAMNGTRLCIWQSVYYIRVVYCQAGHNWFINYIVGYAFYLHPMKAGLGVHNYFGILYSFLKSCWNHQTWNLISRGLRAFALLSLEQACPIHFD